MPVAVVVVAAGEGRRFGGPKQWRIVAGHPLVYWPLKTLEGVPLVKEIVLVSSADRLSFATTFVKRCGFKKVFRVVSGGAERSDSVRAGLRAVSEGISVTLVHDAARALVSRVVVERVALAAHRSGVALAARPVTDTVKHGQFREGRCYVTRTVPRENLWMAQTPQGFRADVLKKMGTQRVARLTDDVQWAERLRIPVELVEGSVMNFKVTIPEDFKLCRKLLCGGKS